MTVQVLANNTRKYKEHKEQYRGKTILKPCVKHLLLVKHRKLII